MTKTLRNGSSVPAGPACWACFEAYDKGGWVEDFPSWSDLCLELVGNDDLSNDFQKTVDLVTGAKKRDFNDQTVRLLTRTGTRITSKYVLLRGSALDAATGGLGPKPLKLTLQSIPSEDGGENQ